MVGPLLDAQKHLRQRELTPLAGDHQRGMRSAARMIAGGALIVKRPLCQLYHSACRPCRKLPTQAITPRGANGYDPLDCPLP